MKRIQYANYGGPETMYLQDFQLENLGPDQVAVRISHTAINPIDWKVRRGALKMVTGKSFPRAMGSDFSGTVIAVGTQVTRYKPGDAVFGMARLKESGALGEAVITKESFIAKKPENVSFEQAACLATPGVMAWNGLVDKAAIKPGQTVFVNGCMGAVGRATVQLALIRGASVAGSCNADSLRNAQDMGVYPVFDYRKTNLATLKDRFDVVYDTSATMPTKIGLQLARKGGVFLDINPTPIKFLLSLVNRRLKPLVCTARADILDALAEAAASGRLSLPIGEIVALTDAIRLITDLEGGRIISGKGVIQMG